MSSSRNPHRLQLRGQHHKLATVFIAASLLPALLLVYVSVVHLLPAARAHIIAVRPAAVLSLLIASIILSIAGFVLILRTAGRLGSLSESLIDSAPLTLGRNPDRLEQLDSAARKLKDTSGKQKKEIWHLKQQLAILKLELKRVQNKSGLGSISDQTWDFDGWQEYLSHEIERARRYHRLFCVAFVKIQEFRERTIDLPKNEREDIARLVTEKVHGWVRSSDLMAGDPTNYFVLLLPETNSEGGLKVTERIAARLPEEPFVARSALEGMHFGANIGIANYPSDARDAPTLIQSARAALSYSTKLDNGPVSAYDRHLMSPGNKAQP